MKPINFSAVTPQEWDTLVDCSDDAWLFTRYRWVLFEQKHVVVDNLSFAIKDKDRIAAIVPLYKYVLGLGAWSEILVSNGLHRAGGVIFHPQLEKTAVHEVRSIVMKEIFERAKQVKADRISLGQQTLCPNILWKSGFQIPFWILNYGFHLGLNIGPSGICPAPFMATCAADLVVLLETPEHELFGALNTSCRRGLRKAENIGFSFQKLEGIDKYREYYELYKTSCSRRNETPKEFEYFEDLFLNFGEKNLLVFGVEHEKTLVAAITLLIDKDCISCLSDATLPKYLDIGVVDYLHWSTILTLKKEGFKAYRLGPYFPTIPKDWPVERVTRFKTKFGGTPFLLDQSSYFLSPEKYIKDISSFFENSCLDLLNQPEGNTR